MSFELCPACGLDALSRNRVVSPRPTSIEALACEACGEWWFESDGARLTTESLRTLGLDEPRPSL